MPQEAPSMPGSAADPTAGSPLLHPPRPPLAFRVGVLGHRPDRLGQADLPRLGHVLRSLLDAVRKEVESTPSAEREFYSSDPTVLRAVSPLAEGVDRLFAETALELGYALCCVLPFPQSEFERDFTEERAKEPRSLERFRELLGNATTCFEFDGQRSDESGAYGASGDVVLAQSDLLVVVWDGVRENKRGGTEETLDEARRRGVPVVWIDARTPHSWQRLESGQALPRLGVDGRAVPDGSGSADVVRRMAREVLALPEPRAVALMSHVSAGASIESPRANLERFYAERRPRRTLAIVWKAFRDVLGDSRLPSITTQVGDFEDAVTAEWEQNRCTPVAAVVDMLRPFYAWSDRLAVLYSDRYRSAFIMAFLLAAAAVGMALVPVGLMLADGGGGETTSTVLELLSIATILTLVVLGRRRSWHERWIDYRLAAELVRHLRLVAPLGGRRPFAQVPAHLATYGQPEGTWMDWYVRALTRAVGLPNARLDRLYLKSCLDQLRDVLVVQQTYHEATRRRSDRIEHRLQLAGFVLLGLTLLSCVLHLLHLLLPGHLLIFLCGFVPALVAGLAGVANQGEFRRVGKRSEAMRQRLDLLVERVDRIASRLTGTEAALRSFAPEVSALASEAAGLLVSEVLDWRVVFLDRPLTVT